MKWTFDNENTPYPIDCKLRSEENDLKSIGVIANEGVTDLEELEETVVEELDGVESLSTEGQMLGTSSTDEYISADSPFANIIVETNINPSNSKLAIQTVNSVAMEMIKQLYPATYDEHNGFDVGPSIESDNSNSNNPA